MSGFKKILDNHARVVEHGFIKEGSLRYGTYAVSNLRGGVGKTSLAFNLSYEISRNFSLLVADICPQCNLTETILRGVDHDVSILDALQPKILGSAFGDEPDDISYLISNACESFKGGKKSFFIPGDPEMFAFPSELYQQLQLANVRGRGRKDSPVEKILLSLKEILKKEANLKGCDKILIDTSPFYGGGTHLSWCAADAIIIPVRVDEHSIESLKLTFEMLSSKNKDFAMWNDRAGINGTPKVAAIVMTMAGSKSRLRSTPDTASRMYIERAYELASLHPELFDYQDIADAFVILDDFVSSGRISGAKSIPIAKLKVNSFHRVEGKRLQVNSSVNRYQNELRYLASIL